MKCISPRTDVHGPSGTTVRLISNLECVHPNEEPIKYTPGKYLRQGFGKPLFLIEKYDIE